MPNHREERNSFRGGATSFSTSFNAKKDLIEAAGSLNKGLKCQNKKKTQLLVSSRTNTKCKCVD